MRSVSFERPRSRSTAEMVIATPAPVCSGSLMGLRLCRPLARERHLTRTNMESSRWWGDAYKHPAPPPGHRHRQRPALRSSLQLGIPAAELSENAFLTTERVAHGLGQGQRPFFVTRFFPV